MKRVLPLLSLALLIGLVFRSSLSFEFLSWDDDVNITAHPAVQGQHYLWIWTHFYYGLYVPLSYSLWAVLTSLRDEPWLFHLANLVLHICNTSLVFLIFRRRFEIALVPAFLSAALFGLHPMQVETVAWVSGLRDLGSVFFALASLYIFLSRRKEALALLLFALALLMKPSLVVLPILLFWLDGRILRKSAWAWFGVAMLAVGVSVLAQQDLGSTEPAPWALRALESGKAYLFYLSKICWPMPLAVDYSHQISFIYGLLPLGVGLWWRPGRRAFLFIFLSLLPTIGLVPFAFQYVSPVADHYAYFAMVGVAWWLASWASSRVRLGVLAVLVAVSAGVAEARLPIWRSDESFYPDMVFKNPLSFSGHNGMADLLRVRGQSEAAIPEYRQALLLQPTFGSAILNLTATLSAQNRDAEILQLLGTVLNKPFQLTSENRPYYANLFYFYGLAQERQNQAEAAFQSFCRAYQIRPDSRILREALDRSKQLLIEPRECL